MGTRGASKEHGRWPNGPGGEPALYVRLPLNPAGRLPNRPRPDPWRLEVVYVQRGGQLVVANLRIYVESSVPGDEGERTDRQDVNEAIRAKLPPEGLTSANLRALNLSSMRREYEQLQRRIVLEHGLDDYLDLRPRRSRLTAQQGQALTDDEWAGFCLDYLEVVADPRHRRTPLIEMVRRYSSRSDLPDDELKTLLRDRLNLARRHDWLTFPGKGRPGGEPGDRLKDWKKNQQAKQEQGKKRKRGR